MSGIRTSAAATMLGVSPNTLRSWERRYGYPSPRRSPGGHRQYELAEIETLRTTLDQTRNVSSAIALARQRGDGPPSAARLSSAFATFDEDGANRLLEESLALRSVERTIEDLLPPGGRAADQGPARRRRVRVCLAVRHRQHLNARRPSSPWGRRVRAR
ncbi:MAG TPA: MerR family DNA-binding transcriptional regulator [Solirubrobacteraceae bacterium]